MRPSCYRNFKGIITPSDDERKNCDECEYRYWCQKETIKLHDEMKAEIMKNPSRARDRV
jgi:hypothetical protein